jgi:hypothetical protein
MARSESANGAIMKPDRFDKGLLALRRRNPFHPFLVELTSGAVLHVEHPEALVVRNGEAVFIDRDGEIVFFDHDTVARLIRPSTKNGAKGPAK